MEIYTAKNLHNYIERISVIAEQTKNKAEPGVLWFRGDNSRKHDLIPSMFRVKELFEAEDDEQYTRRHYAEEMRMQNYIAKNYHFLSKTPTSRIEWLEVMQHHRMKTRLLDWSESSIHSILFAVEPFLNPTGYDPDKRAHWNACVWILDPLKLNRNIIKAIIDDNELCMQLLKLVDIKWTPDIARIIHTQTEHLGIFPEKEKPLKDISHIQVLVNLSTLDEKINNDYRIRERLLSGEYPYILYLLSRIYADGYTLDKRNLAPLAIVEPYLSQRIQAQKGVFTIFPHYKENDGDQDLREIGIDPNAMQRIAMTADCIYRIDLDDPQEIASNLLSNGIQSSWLYPELPRVGYELEGRKVYN